MARVPVAENFVRQQPVTEAKFRAFDSGADMVGAGIADFGKSMERAGNVLERVAEVRAEEEARRLDVEHMEQARTLREKVRSSRGINARSAAEEAEKELTKLNQGFMSRASNPLAKRMLERSLQQRTMQELDGFSTHALGEETKAIDEGFSARIEGFGETALDHAEDDAVFNENISAGTAEIAQRGGWAGWDGDRIKREQAEFKSRVLAGKARSRFMNDDPQGALALLDSHAGEIDADTEATLRGAIKPQLDDLQADSDVAMVMSGVKPDALPDVPPGETTFQSPIRAQTVTVPGGRYGAPRPYGAHAGVDQAGVKPGTPVYPIAEGTVAKVYKSEGGGNTVELNLAGGWKVKYLHLADGSTAAVREGQRVGVNDIVGGVGNTGKASKGAHLHTEVYDPSGKRVDPSKLYGQAAPRTPAPNGTRVDLADGYAKIDAMPWSPARKSRARERLRSFAGENDTVRARAEQDADRAITQKLVDIETGGGKLTSTSQIDPVVLANASPQTRLQILGMIEANTRPKPIEANGDTVLAMELASIYEPDKFAQADLRLYRHQMTDAEFASLATKQAQMRTQGPKAPIAVQHEGIWTTINRYGPDAGLDPKSKKPEDRQRSFRVFDMMRTHLQSITEGKRAATDDEVKSAFDRATMEVVVRSDALIGTNERTMRRFEQLPEGKQIVKVPNDVLSRIVGSYQRTQRRAPTQAEAVQIYLANKGKPGFWP